jgi:predicted aspartyl protease
MKRLMLGLMAAALLLAPSAITRAQDAPKPEGKKTEAAPADKEMVSVDFETVGGLMFVKVKVNDKGPYDFLFDSGAQISVISKRLADELDLEMADMPGGGMQGVGKAEAKACVVDGFQIGSFKRGKTGCGSLDMDHVSGGLGRHMMGIIGQNVIKQMRTIEIDFSTSKLSFKLYPSDEMPTDQTEQAIIAAVEGGGMPGIPGIPGLPGPGNPPREPGKKGEDEFSLPPMLPGQFLFQDGSDDRKTESKPARRGPKDGMTLTYTTGELTIPILNQTMEVTPFWHVEAVVNGKSRRFMFDTGASALLVLADAFVEELSIPTSFSFMVKGVSEGTASAGLVDSFELGSVKDVDVPFMSNALFKVSDQVRDQLGPFGRMLQGLDSLDFDGIIGISFCHRFKKTIVDTKERTLRFEPYEETEENASSPYEGEDTMKEAVVRTWNGQAGEFGLTGDGVPLHEWEKHGLETGGLLIKEVAEDGPAAKAGLKVDDIITHVLDPDAGDSPLADAPSLIVYGCLNDPGTEVTIRVKRGDELIDLKVVLSKYQWEGKFPERFKRE